MTLPYFRCPDVTAMLRAAKEKGGWSAIDEAMRAAKLKCIECRTGCRNMVTESTRLHAKQAYLLARGDRVPKRQSGTIRRSERRMR